MSIPLADTPTVGLGQFIRESRFVVPTHQRDYSWTDEVSDFLRDIEEAKKNTTDIYFTIIWRATKIINVNRGVE